MTFHYKMRTNTVAGLAACALLSNSALAEPVQAAAERAQIPFESAAIHQTGRDFLITWRAPGAGVVKVYTARGPERFQAVSAAATAGAVGRVTLRLPAAPRWYFELTPAKGGSLVIAPRSLHISATNARDVGGYRTADGDWVRIGEAYRSNALFGIGQRDVSVLEALHIRTIVDLRTAAERRRWPDPVVGGATEIDADVLADDRQKMQAWAKQAPGPSRTRSGGSPVAGLRAKFQEIYRDFVRLPSARHAYHTLLVRLADPASLPALFHCTDGKDRTGWAQAVLLTILGVPRPVITKDYVLSGHYLEPSAIAKRLPPGVSPALARQLAQADPADLQAAFDEVDRRYGSFDRYLHVGLGLDARTLAAIRRNFLTQ
jgi:protein-tyrosine phosphatase